MFVCMFPGKEKSIMKDSFYIDFDYSKDKKRVYFIKTAAGKPLASFDRLNTAATVFRYLTGAEMTESDTEAAHRALKGK